MLTFIWQVNCWSADQWHQRHVSWLYHPSPSPDYCSAWFAHPFPPTAEPGPRIRIPLLGMGAALPIILIYWLVSPQLPTWNKCYWNPWFYNEWLSNFSTIIIKDSKGSNCPLSVMRQDWGNWMDPVLQIEKDAIKWVLLKSDFMNYLPFVQICQPLLWCQLFLQTIAELLVGLPLVPDNKTNQKTLQHKMNALAITY